MRGRKAVFVLAACLAAPGAAFAEGSQKPAQAPMRSQRISRWRASSTRPGRPGAASAPSRRRPRAGFFILTPETPISACPAKESDGALAFDVVCDGPNSGHAEASCELFDDSFRGRIEMLAGGKNMRMTEVQEGRRVGDCAENAP